jgi:hypothetical protein
MTSRGMGECHVTGERMAKILNFRSADLRRPESMSVACGSASAEVIVFPGVRYERWDQQSETQAREASTTKRRRRDVLELAE